MKEKELHLREFAREGRSALPAEPSGKSVTFTAEEGFARSRIYAILIYGCRF
jgi:hypothetical protein